jgi:hypothetical protein
MGASRWSLCSAGTSGAHLYLAEEKPDGTIVLTPERPASDGMKRLTAVSVPRWAARLDCVWKASQVRARSRRAPNWSSKLHHDGA